MIVVKKLTTIYISNCLFACLSANIFLIQILQNFDFWYLVVFCLFFFVPVPQALEALQAERVEELTASRQVSR